MVEIEDQNEQKLSQITSDLKKSKKELEKDHDSIINKTKQVKIERKNLKNSINNNICDHKEHSYKQKDLIVELNEKEKLIVKTIAKSRSNNQMIKHQQETIVKLE